MHDSARMRRAFAVAEMFCDMVASNLGTRFDPHQFPRDMATLISDGLELPIIVRPALTLRSAAHYLCLLHGEPIESSGEADDRALYGLLHVGPPANLILLRGGLSLHVANYVLAHEVGHFLADLFAVKQLWLQVLSQQAEAVERAFCWQEPDAGLELHAFLKGLPPRPVAITGRGNATRRETAEREIQADLIARELIAPWNQVAPFIPTNPPGEVIAILHEQFGLPLPIATPYENDLRTCLQPPPDTLDRLFAPLLQPRTP